MKQILIGAGLALWSAVAMTMGDWIWAALSLRHRPQYGLAHGTLLCLWMGLYLGVVAKRVLIGMGGGAAVGFLAAASFYALAPLLGYSAMFLSWMLLWFGLAMLAGRLAGTPPSLAQPSDASSGAASRLRWSSWAFRGLVAAVGSAIAFYAVSGIWMQPTTPPDYAWHFAAWTIAFLPGSLALLGQTRASRASE